MSEASSPQGSTPQVSSPPGVKNSSSGFSSGPYISDLEIIRSEHFTTPLYDASGFPVNTSQISNCSVLMDGSIGAAYGSHISGFDLIKSGQFNIL